MKEKKEQKAFQVLILQKLPNNQDFKKISPLANLILILQIAKTI